MTNIPDKEIEERARALLPCLTAGQKSRLNHLLLLRRNGQSTIFDALENLYPEALEKSEKKARDLFNTLRDRINNRAEQHKIAFAVEVEQGRNRSTKELEVLFTYGAAEPPISDEDMDSINRTGHTLEDEKNISMIRSMAARNPKFRSFSPTLTQITNCTISSKIH